MNSEILAKARAAKSPEELLKTARENGMPEFTEENARDVYNSLHRSGELSDGELNSAVGGCGGSKTAPCECAFCHGWLRKVAFGYIPGDPGDYYFFRCDHHDGWLYYLKGDRYVMVRDTEPRFRSLYDTNYFNPPKEQVM